jgi:hypothetical protein
MLNSQTLLLENRDSDNANKMPREIYFSGHFICVIIFSKRIKQKHFPKIYF